MKKILPLSLMSLALFACASTEEKNLEKARFLLDEGRFEEAIALVEPIVASEPNNNEAKFVLGSALIGSFALSPKPGCDPDDTGYLGALACLLEDTNNDESGLETFGRISPEDDSFNDDIQRAVEVLSEIDEFTLDLPVEDVALQRLIARAFALSTIYEKIGANSENEECNAGGAGVDDVPDEYNSNVITTADATAFRANLEGIEIDADLAGLGDDFELFTRAGDILDDIEATGQPIRTAVRTVFDDTYNSADQQICN